MTLDEIAHAMNETRESLSDHIIGRWKHAEVHIRKRRRFIHRAFLEGHTPEAIGEYLDRSQTMVQHALRMICVDEHHTKYGLTQAEINFQLRGRAA